MPGKFHLGGFDDIVASARERAREDLARYAKENQYVHGPVEYEVVQDTVGPRSMSYYSLIGWAPAIKNPAPAHMEEVIRYLSRPIKQLKQPLVIKQYEPEPVN